MLMLVILFVKKNMTFFLSFFTPSFPLQIRRALLQIFFPEKPFHWARHTIIAFCLIFMVNLLVIFVPSIRDIFGLIGMFK